MPKAKTIMVQGTASGVGKSFLVAALCRIFKRRGFRVAPFKAQNMSNNSFVAREGGEIGRAQAMQAECAGVKPSIHMNPILLKPHSDSRSQVVVHGRPVAHMNVYEYYAFQEKAFSKIKESFFSLLGEFDVVVIEGAGSPAEINLRDFVNMKVAQLANSPVLLVGDIERGGVFASLFGTYALLQPQDRKRIEGFVINKFRGDARLLDNGIRFLEKKTNVPILGVVPYVNELFLDEEDSLDLSDTKRNNQLDIAIFRFPRISNFTDFKALELEPNVSVRYFTEPHEFGDPNLLVLPGTKSTVKDLAFLQRKGMGTLIKRYVSRGGIVLGVCGGFQMLGEKIEDAYGVETKKQKISGIGLLPIRTSFGIEKVTKEVETWAEFRSNGHLSRERVKGYEIHMGHTVGLDNISGNQALLRKGNVYGTYLHGLFDSDAFRRKFLRMVGRNQRSRAPLKNVEYSREKQNSYRRVAEAVEKAIDMNRVLSLLR